MQTLLWFCQCPPELCQLSSDAAAEVFPCWQMVSLLKKSGISCEESRDGFPEVWDTQKHFNQLVNYCNIITGVLLPFVWVTSGCVLGNWNLGVLRMWPAPSQSHLHITLPKIKEGEKQSSRHHFMLLELFPPCPQQGDGGELFSPAKELQFLMLCAQGQSSGLSQQSS